MRAALSQGERWHSKQIASSYTTAIYDQQSILVYYGPNRATQNQGCVDRARVNPRPIHGVYVSILVHNWSLIPLRHAALPYYCMMS